MRVRRILCRQPCGGGRVCEGHMRLKPPRLLRCERCSAERIWERVPCIVPFCGRTFKAQGWDVNEEVCCGKHWRTASEDLRKQHAEARQIHRTNYRAWERTPEGSAAQAAAAARCDTSAAACHDVWLLIKADIIETAGVMA